MTDETVTSEGAPTPAIPVDKLVRAYIKIRDARAKLKEEYEARDAELDGDMKTISDSLLELCKATGADSIRTPNGTAIRTVKTRYWTSDWDSMYNFVKEHDAFALLERRIHQTNMQAWLGDNPEALPPGLNSESSYSISVRRK